MLLTPLEQFQVISLFSVNLFGINIFLTNIFLINMFVLLFFVVICSFLLPKLKNFKRRTFFLVPINWQILLEFIYEISFKLTYDNINFEGEKYFPFVIAIFSFILLNNIIGLVPYSFTVTSHLIVTFSLSLSIFIGINIICVGRHGLSMVSLFIPSNTPFILALLLVPIEFVSYVFKPVSLGVRLFANLMAGHTLLKVIIGFSWGLLILDNFLSVVHVLPLLIILMLLILELGVAIIQAYVFVILICIYLNDSINLH